MLEEEEEEEFTEDVLEEDVLEEDGLSFCDPSSERMLPLRTRLPASISARGLLYEVMARHH